MDVSEFNLTLGQRLQQGVGLKTDNPGHNQELDENLADAPLAIGDNVFQTFLCKSTILAILQRGHAGETVWR